MAKITPNFDHVSGSFDTDTVKLVCVARKNQMRVDLCVVESGFNLPLAQIKLYSSDTWIAAKNVFEDAQNLGNEIAVRWNNHTPKSINKIRAEFESNFICPEFDFIEEWDGENYKQKDLNILWQIWKASRQRALRLDFDDDVPF